MCEDNNPQNRSFLEGKELPHVHVHVHVHVCSSMFMFMSMFISSFLPTIFIFMFMFIFMSSFLPTAKVPLGLESLILLRIL
jgi:hypothetical protein